MSKRLITNLILMVLVAGCNRPQEQEPNDLIFAGYLLQDGQANVPVNIQLQVFMGGKVSGDEFGALTAVLTEAAAGRVVPGSPDYKPELMVFVYIPGGNLRPGTAYILTITAPGGETFVYHFTTAAGVGSPPEITITPPAENDTVAGVIRVEAVITDDTGISGNVISSLEGTDTGWRLVAPWFFYINTVTVGNGLRLIEVRASDGDGNLGTGSVQVNAQNGTPSATPFWIFDEGLEPSDGLTPSPAFKAAMPPAGGVFIVLHALTDANTDLWNDPGMVVGQYELTSGYAPDPSFASPGVPCLEIRNFSGTAFVMPASVFTVVLPDHSTLNANLPAVTINHTWAAAFYLAADGTAHWAYSPPAPQRFAPPPNVLPSAVFPP